MGEETVMSGAGVFGFLACLVLVGACGGASPSVPTGDNRKSPETTLVSGPPAVTNQTSAVFLFESGGNVAIGHFECRLNDDDWEACGSPRKYVDLHAGPHRFEVRAADAGGSKLDESPARWAWTIDREAPQTLMLASPPAITNATTMVFFFGGSDDTEIRDFDCQLDDEPWRACSSPQTYVLVMPGLHAFAARAVDTAGNIDSTPVFASTTVDTSPPETFLDTLPPPVAATTAASFVFSGADDHFVGHYECRLDATPWVDCASPMDYSGLSTGAHDFAVRAVDGASTADPTPESTGWIIDLTPPATLLTRGPASITNATNASFEFNGNDNVGFALFECRLDQNAWAPCVSPVQYSNLSTQSTHRFEVRAVDFAALADPSPAEWTWFVGTFSAVSISAGAAHTCALTSQGGVKCWGDNSTGQLGDATTAGKIAPTDVVTLSGGVAAIAAGTNHTCALTTSGGVKCWGLNIHGQLGDGTVVTRSSPVDVSLTTSQVVALATGFSHVCALTTTGGVKCWGSNSYGQLGDGTYTERRTPVDVTGLTEGVAAITAGQWHTCAVSVSGGLKCWGSSYFGQLGDGFLGTGPSAYSNSPLDVSGLTSGVAAVAAGQAHTCAVGTSGGVKCWGANGGGQLGDGTRVNRTTPVTASGLSGITSLAPGAGHTCALTSGNGVKCWGINEYGQLGDGTNEDKLTAVDAAGLGSGVLAIAAGGGHTCALDSAGRVKCWGHNGAGQVGANIAVDKTTAVEAGGLATGAIALSTGQEHTCALTPAGGVKCWGGNHEGQLGDDTLRRKRTATAVIGLASEITSVKTGESHSCALTSAGGVLCWGKNFSGQLGDGTSTPRYTPVPVSGLGSGVVALALGRAHSCALTTSGGIKCWGGNYSGELGDGSTTTRTTPVDVSGFTAGAAAIAAGHDFTCAVTTTGAVKCWGSNSGNQLGIGLGLGSTTPVDVVGLSSGMLSVTAGESHACALGSTGGVKCWGTDTDGQLGDGAPSYSPTAVDVIGLSEGVAAISAGRWNTCALTTTGAMKCWGGNRRGQLGDGTKTDKNAPVDVAGLSSGVTAMATGDDHTCALVDSGRVLCWGYNAEGQLGDGAAWFPIAVAVAGFW